VRCGGVDALATADICLSSLPGTCPLDTAASSGCHDDVPCVVTSSTSHCGRCPAGRYGNGSVCERKSTYTRWAEKRGDRLMTIILSNLNRLKKFHCKFP